MWLFGLYIARHLYKWQLIDEENDLILWKLNYIQMKILNGIACNFDWNWISWIELNSNSSIYLFENCLVDL
jgi:hypothetical protein